MFQRCASRFATSYNPKFFSNLCVTGRHFSTDKVPNVSQKAAAAAAAAVKQAPKTKSASREEIPIARLVLASSIVCIATAAGIYGAAQYYKVSPQELVEETIKTINQNAEEFIFELNEAAYQRFSNKEPLLPDEIPEMEKQNIPCFIIEFDRVLVRWVHSTRTGWRCVWRPGAYKMLQDLSNIGEVYIWSDDVMGTVQEGFSQNNLPEICDVIHSECIRKYHGKHVKDLTRLGRSLRRVIQIDHDADHLSMQPENGILIREYEGDEDDREMFYYRDALIDMCVKGRQESRDYRDLIQQYGGGDVDFGRRHIIERKAKEEKFKKLKGVGKRFSIMGGGNPVKELGPK